MCVLFPQPNSLSLGLFRSAFLRVHFQVLELLQLFQFRFYIVTVDRTEMAEGGSDVYYLLTAIRHSPRTPRIVHFI